MQVQIDLSQLSDASLHTLLEQNQGTPLGTQILEELLGRESTIKLKPDFEVGELKAQLR